MKREFGVAHIPVEISEQRVLKLAKWLQTDPATRVFPWEKIRNFYYLIEGKRYIYVKISRIDPYMLLYGEDGQSAAVL